MSYKTEQKKICLIRWRKSLGIDKHIKYLLFVNGRNIYPFYNSLNNVPTLKLLEP